MNVLAKVVRAIGWIWIALAGIVIFLSYVMILFTKGFWTLQETLSPFNLWNFIAVALTLAPGLVLLQLAEAIEQGRRGKALGTLVALPITVGIVIVMVLLLTNRQRPHSESDNRTQEYKAASIRVLNQSATMHQHKNYFITQTSGPVGTEGIPEVIKLGDTVTVKGKTILVRHIFVTEILADMKWGAEVLAKKGDVRCVIVESEENLPYGEEKRNRLWIYVEQCVPIARQTTEVQIGEQREISR